MYSSSCFVGAGIPDIVRGVYPCEGAYGNILIVFREKKYPNVLEVSEKALPLHSQSGKPFALNVTMRK